MLKHVSVLHSFLLTNNSPFYGSNCIFLIHLLACWTCELSQCLSLLLLLWIVLPWSFLFSSRMCFHVSWLGFIPNYWVACATVCVTFFFGGTGGWIQGLTHARKVLRHWAVFLTLLKNFYFEMCVAKLPGLALDSKFSFLSLPCSCSYRCVPWHRFNL